MDLSIAIVNWNSGYLLGKCLDSIYRTVKNLDFEVFVMDNASSDFSLKCLKRFPDVKLVRNKRNLGFAKANNQAIRISKGEYVLLLNPDTIILEDSLENVVSYMGKNLDVGVLGCKLLNLDKTIQPSCHAFLSLAHVFFEVSQFDRLFPKTKFFVKFFKPLSRLKLFMNYSVPNKTAEVDSVMGSCYMIRKKALEKTGLLDEGFFLYHEEMELSYRMWQQGYKVIFYPYASIIHWNKDSTKKVPDLVYYERCRSILHFFKKHKHMQLNVLRLVMFFSLFVNFFSLPFRQDFKKALKYRLEVLELLR